MNKHYIRAFILGLSLMSAYAVGGGSVINVAALVADGASASKAFVGLNWSLGGSATPELILGLSNGRNKADGNVQGSKIAAHFDLESGFTPSKVKATALSGPANQRQRIEFGAGYDFLGGGLVGVVGLNSGNLALGVDVNMDMELTPYTSLLSTVDFPSTGLACAKSMQVNNYFYVSDGKGPDKAGQCRFDQYDN